ncbi:MAG: CHAT domain-containing protein [Crocosphaera sp.]
MPQEVELNLTEQTNNQTSEQFFRVELRITNGDNSLKIHRRRSVSSIPEELLEVKHQWQKAFSELVEPRGTNTLSVTPDSSKVVDHDDPITLNDDEEDDDPITPNNNEEDEQKENGNLNCWQSHQDLTRELNKWLNSDKGWSKIGNWLKQYLQQSEEEIRVTIQTDNPLLKQLPWQEWDIFAKDYPQAEFAISPPEYEPPEGWEKIKGYPQVRILVILGSNSNETNQTDLISNNNTVKIKKYQKLLNRVRQPIKKIQFIFRPILVTLGYETKKKNQTDLISNNNTINIEQDKELWNRVREHGANIYILEQPRLLDLQRALVEKPGWNIIFYAGHSKTNEAGEGVLFVNPDDENGVTINEVENEFIAAIKNGLQLAIFNSCDGLGIANKLAELRLPQSIVMKEPVDDQMAIDFLAHFLDSFSRNNPLFIAVNQARKYLEETYNNPEKYPGGHGLPVIVPNPAVPLPTWKGFLSEAHLPLKWLIPILIAAFVGVIGLPFSIIYEFGFEKFLFYAKLYPHIILFPPIAFWAAIWSVYKGFGQIHHKSRLNLGFCGILLVSIVITFIEITSPHMMLFELSSSAQSNINNQTILALKTIPNRVDNRQNVLENIKTIPSEIVDIHKIVTQDSLTINKSILETALSNYLKLKINNKITKEEAIGFHQLMYLGSDYKTTWKNRKNWFSLSRWFYIYTFWILIFTVLIFVVFWVQSQEPRQFYNHLQYIKYLVFSQVVILLWMPFRLYYVIEPKSLIFGYNNFQWLQQLDPFVYLVISVLLLTTALKTYQRKEIRFLFILPIIVISFSLWLGHRQTELLSRLFGLNTVDWRVWLVYPLFTGGCVYLFLNYQNRDFK